MATRTVLVKSGGSFDSSILKLHGNPELFGREVKKGESFCLITYMGSRHTRSYYCHAGEKNNFILSKVKKGRTIANREHNLLTVDLEEVVIIQTRD